MTASSLTTCRWLPEAIADLERLAGEAGPALRADLGAFLGRLATVNGAASLAEALSRPASTPFVPAIDACAADLGLLDDPRAALLGRSAVLLYAYVRLQDDLVDEPQLVPRAAIYATEALLCEHLALFAAAVTAPRAFVLRSTVMRRFADVAAAEVADRERGWDGRTDCAWIGEKALPIAVPLVGLAVLAGREELCEPLTQFVVQVGTGLQLVNDLFNSQDDAAAGRVTPLLRWLGPVPQGSSLRAHLLCHPVLERALAEARRAIDAAEALALSHGLPRTAAIAGRARQMVDAAPQRLLRLLLGMPVS